MHSSRVWRRLCSGIKISNAIQCYLQGSSTERGREVKTETISVVIPAFNAAKTLDRALCSVLHQEVLPDEVIVIDDGSTDQTAQIAKSHLVNGKIPTRVISKTNQGVSIARNLGIVTASSQYIALLDADDEHCKNHIKLLREAIKRHPDVTLYFSGIERFFDNDSEACHTEKNSLPDFSAMALKHWPAGNHSIYGVLNQTLFDDLLKGSFIPLSTAAFPRLLQGKPAEFKSNLSYGEDRDFLIRTISEGSALFINEISGIIHRDGSNVSSIGNSTKNHPQKLKSLIEIGRLDFIKNNKKYSETINLCISDCCRSNAYHASFEGISSYAKSIKAASQNMDIFAFQNHPFLIKNALRSLFFSMRPVQNGAQRNRPAKKS